VSAIKIRTIRTTKYMDRHLKWYENIKIKYERTYFPIPEMLHIDPFVKSYSKGGDEGHLYIVKLPHENGFKIGSTTQLIIRMYYYPIGTELLFCIKVESNLRREEKTWIKNLKKDKRFKLYKGREWFIGSHTEAIDILQKSIARHNVGPLVTTNL